MIMGMRHEEYGPLTDGLPFVLNRGIKRTHSLCSGEHNWHDDLEIQLCTAGSGTVLLDGKVFSFQKNDVVVVNSNVIHYTGTDTELIYDCIIISADFCKKVGLDKMVFTPFIQNPRITELFAALTETFSDKEVLYRVAKLNQILLQLLIELAEHYAAPEGVASADKDLDRVKAAVLYIRKNHNRKITLDEISKAVLYDKYALCRKFKIMTGQTVVQSINRYRCIQAIDYLNAGYPVAQTAYLCGFENLSFFTKTFKKYVGRLPSSYQKTSL